MWVKLAAIFTSHFPGNGKFIPPIRMVIFSRGWCVYGIVLATLPHFQRPPLLGIWISIARLTAPSTQKTQSQAPRGVPGISKSLAHLPSSCRLPATKKSNWGNNMVDHAETGRRIQYEDTYMHMCMYIIYIYVLYILYIDK